MSAFLIHRIIACYFRKYPFIPLDIQQIVIKYFGGNEERFVVHNGDNVKLSEDGMTASIKENLFEYVTIYGNVIIDAFKNKEFAEYIWKIDVPKCSFLNAPIFVGIDSSPMTNCLKMNNFANKSTNKCSFFAFGFDGRAYAQNMDGNGQKICNAIQNNWRIKTKLVLNVKKKTLMIVINRWWTQKAYIHVVAKHIDLTQTFRFAASMKYKEESVKILKFEAMTKEVDHSIHDEIKIEDTSTDPTANDEID